MTDVTADPGYHKQPFTLDPTKDEIPEDAPSAMGHLTDVHDTAAAVREADQAHREQTEAETKARDEAAENGEAAPGDLPTPLQERNAERNEASSRRSRAKDTEKR
jgi:hypothetical protein